LSGYNQTVKYDKFRNVLRIVRKIGAKDRVSLGTQGWQSSYSTAFAADFTAGQVLYPTTPCFPRIAQLIQRMRA
jgi:hypothetical protein